MFEEKRLSNDGTDTARSEQADQGSKEMDEKNHEMAHRRMVARREILRDRGRNNNSPATRVNSRIIGLTGHLLTTPALSRFSLIFFFCLSFNSRTLLRRRISVDFQGVASLRASLRILARRLESRSRRRQTLIAFSPHYFRSNFSPIQEGGCTARFCVSDTRCATY